MVHYVIEYDILSALITLILFIAHVFLPAKNKKLRRVYLMMIAVVFLCCVFDTSSSIMLMHPKKTFQYDSMLFLVNAIYHFVHMMPLPLVAYYMYYSVSDKKLSKWKHLALCAPAIGAFMVVILNKFNGMLFNIKDGVYTRGWGLYIMYIFAFLYLVAILGFFIMYFSSINWSIKFFVYVYTSVSIIALTIQYFFPEQLVECAAMTVILLSVHFAIQSKDMIDEAIKKQTEIAEAANIANQAKSDFLANMSHEIRTPINTMLAMNHMIIKESDSLTIKRYAQDSQYAGKVLLSLINDILDFSKIESGKMVIRESEYVVEDYIRLLIDEIRPRANGKKLDFIINVDPMIPKKLIGDETRIHQVTINLLTNAVKYTERGYIELNISYERINESELYLIVAVKDSGIGIKDEDKSKVANRFQRFELDKNRNIEGTGLGLSITSQILNLMNSKLDFDSKFGVGSNFSFRLKQKISDNTSLGNVSWLNKYSIIEDEDELFKAPDAFILGVDDNEMNLMVLRKLLKANEVKIVTVSSGVECLKACKKMKFDLIFLDYMMPHMDGEETLSKLRSDPEILKPDTPVIALTANAISGMRDKYIEQGFDEYLSKPIDYKELEKVMLKFIPEEKIADKYE